QGAEAEESGSDLLLQLGSCRAAGWAACRRQAGWVRSCPVIRFPALRRLSLSLLPEITDASLVAVARGCQSLEQLSMSHCGKLTDKGFLEAASSLRRLQHLVISGCSQLTRQTLMAISRECRQLKSLDVSMCHGISMADIELFQAQLPLQTCVQSRFVGGADLSFTL
uniref:F-box/LRR-repeat protein 15-like leucin rich repeat domain-containing protein n=1 Tax=Terrapene triunguis TaxID=2587831 RepID=A0A674IEK8_9SAUR